MEKEHDHHQPENTALGNKCADINLKSCLRNPENLSDSQSTSEVKFASPIHQYYVIHVSQSQSTDDIQSSNESDVYDSDTEIENNSTATNEVKEQPDPDSKIIHKVLSDNLTGTKVFSHSYTVLNQNSVQFVEHAKSNINDQKIDVVTQILEEMIQRIDALNTKVVLDHKCKVSPYIEQSNLNTSLNPVEKEKLFLEMSDHNIFETKNSVEVNSKVLLELGNSLIEVQQDSDKTSQSSDAISQSSDTSYQVPNSTPINSSHNTNHSSDLFSPDINWNHILKDVETKSVEFTDNISEHAVSPSVSDSAYVQPVLQCSNKGNNPVSMNNNETKETDLVQTSTNASIRISDKDKDVLEVENVIDTKYPYENNLNQNTKGEVDETDINERNKIITVDEERSDESVFSTAKLFKCSQNSETSVLNTNGKCFNLEDEMLQHSARPADFEECVNLTDNSLFSDCSSSGKSSPESATELEQNSHLSSELSEINNSLEIKAGTVVVSTENPNIVKSNCPNVDNQGMLHCISKLCDFEENISSNESLFSPLQLSDEAVNEPESPVNHIKQTRCETDDEQKFPSEIPITTDIAYEAESSQNTSILTDSKLVPSKECSEINICDGFDSVEKIKNIPYQATDENHSAAGEGSSSSGGSQTLEFSNSCCSVNDDQNVVDQTCESTRDLSQKLQIFNEQPNLKNTCSGEEKDQENVLEVCLSTEQRESSLTLTRQNAKTEVLIDEFDSSAVCGIDKTTKESRILGSGIISDQQCNTEINYVQNEDTGKSLADNHNDNTHIQMCDDSKQNTKHNQYLLLGSPNSFIPNNPSLTDDLNNETHLHANTMKYQKINNDMDHIQNDFKLNLLYSKSSLHCSEKSKVESFSSDSCKCHTTPGHCVPLVCLTLPAVDEKHNIHDAGDIPETSVDVQYSQHDTVECEFTVSDLVDTNTNNLQENTTLKDNVTVECSNPYSSQNSSNEVCDHSVEESLESRTQTKMTNAEPLSKCIEEKQHIVHSSEHCINELEESDEQQTKLLYMKNLSLSKEKGFDGNKDDCSKNKLQKLNIATECTETKVHSSEETSSKSNIKPSNPKNARLRNCERSIDDNLMDGPCIITDQEVPTEYYQDCHRTADAEESLYDSSNTNGDKPSLWPHSTVFKWKYAPSLDTDTENSANDHVLEDEDRPLSVAPLLTCAKPLRIGLSRRQCVRTLHPHLKRKHEE